MGWKLRNVFIQKGNAFAIQGISVPFLSQTRR